MKKLNIFYWIITGLFSAFMLFSAWPDVINTPEAEAFMTGQLHYPSYFTQFIGVAKILGVIGILIPGFPRITEWAYAGIFFDLIGATYSIVVVAGAANAIGGIVFMTILTGTGAASYLLYHKRLKANANPL